MQLTEITLNGTTYDLNSEIADHSITMEKTDFYYTDSLSKTYSWVYFDNRNIVFDWTQMDKVLEEFPNTLSIVMYPVEDYWTSGGSTLYLETTTHTAQISRTDSTITVDDIKYGIIIIKRSDFEDAYDELEQYVDGGESWKQSSFKVTNTGRIDGSTRLFIAGEVTSELIESNFMQTVMSEDFVTAVKHAMDSDEGMSADEQTAKNRLTGKVMICLGDSYTRAMDGKLTEIANKYGMILDNRGIVSSSICGTWSAATGTGTGYQPMWRRATDIVNAYTNGYTIDETTYYADDVGIVTFMGGANDGFGIETWIGTGIHETDTSLIYGACNHIFNVLATAFTKAKVICITQPSSFNREVSSIADDATAQTLGFENLAELQGMDDIQFSNYAMAQKEKAVYDTAWAYGWNIIDMFHDMPTIFNPANRSAYWNSDKLHLISDGYALITQALDKKIVEVVVG